MKKVILLSMLAIVSVSSNVFAGVLPAPNKICMRSYVIPGGGDFNQRMKIGPYVLNNYYLSDNLKGNVNFLCINPWKKYANKPAFDIFATYQSGIFNTVVNQLCPVNGAFDTLDAHSKLPRSPDLYFNLVASHSQNGDVCVLDHKG